MPLIRSPKPEVVNSGYADVAAADGYFWGYIPVPAGYNVADHYPHIVTAGTTYPVSGVSKTMWVGGYWQDWANNRIVLGSQGNAANYFRVYWEIRKRPVGWKLYQACHAVYTSSVTYTPTNHTITLSSALRSTTRIDVQNPFRGDMPDYYRTTYMKAPGVRITGIQQATFSASVLPAGTWWVPVVVLH